MPSPLTTPMRYARRKPPLGAPIRTGHPLARSLRNCWLLNEGAGMVAFDSCRAANGAFGTGSPTPTGCYWDVSPFGAAVRHNATGTGTFGSMVIDCGANSGPQSQRWSIVLMALHPSAATAGYLGSSTAGGIEIRTETNNVVTLLAQSVALIGQSTGTIALNAWQHIVVTRDASAGTWAIYIQGALAGSGSGVSQTISPGHMLLGASSVNAELVEDAKTAYVQVYDGRMLSPAEVRSLYLAPFQVFG